MIKVYFIKHSNEDCRDAGFLTLPAASEDITAFIARADADAYDVSYKSYFPDLCECFGEHENMGELNYLATLMEDKLKWTDETFRAAIQYGKHTRSVKDLINLVQNLDCYYLYEDSQDEAALGYFCGIELGWLDIDIDEEDSYDYESYGEELHIKLGGEFVDDGYIVYEGSFVEYYSGPDDLPDKYKILAYTAGAEMLA